MENVDTKWNFTWSGEGTFLDGHSSKATTAKLTWDSTGLKIRGKFHTSFYKPEQIKIDRQFPPNELHLRLQSLEGLWIIKDPLLYKNISTLLPKAPRLSSYQYKSHVKWIPIALLFFICLGFFFYYKLLPSWVEITTKYIPLQLEEKLGKQVLDTWISEDDIRRDSVALQVSSTLEDWLHNYMIEKKLKSSFPYQIHFVQDTNTINAFALPGGHIVLYQGLLNFVGSQEELLGILSHEAGHVYHRHSMKHLVRSTFLGIAFSLMLGDVSGVAALLLESSELLLQLSHTREGEREADEFAIQSMLHHKIHPKYLAAFFERLEQPSLNDKKDENESSKKDPTEHTNDTQDSLGEGHEHSKSHWSLLDHLSFLSTHPAGKERIQVFQESYPDSSQPIPTTSLPIHKELWNQLLNKN